MRRRLAPLLAFSLGAALLCVSAANAIVHVPFVGRFTTHRGVLVNLPLVGFSPFDFASHLPCSDLAVMSGPTAAVHPAPFGCAIAFGEIATSALAPGAGFTLPANALLNPLPGMVHAVSLPPPLVQLATSLRVEGPAAARLAPPAGTMATGMNTAAWRVFRAGAWMSQTGRVGSMFTWCPGNPACTNIAQGARPSLPFIVKYAGGGQAFGGTMAMVLSAGANASSLAIGAAGAIGFVRLPDTGSQATGRGYADYLTRALPQPAFWGMYKLMTVTRPVVGMQKLVTMVTTSLGPFPQVKNVQYGFPFTTRTVLVRRSGTSVGNPAITTLSAKGADEAGGGYVRRLTLVAGGISATLPGRRTPVIAQLALPEPSAVGQLLAGAIVLLAIAGSRWRVAS